MDACGFLLVRKHGREERRVGGTLGDLLPALECPRRDELPVAGEGEFAGGEPRASFDIGDIGAGVTDLVARFRLGPAALRALGLEFRSEVVGCAGFRILHALLRTLGHGCARFAG